MNVHLCVCGNTTTSYSGVCFNCKQSSIPPVVMTGDDIYYDSRTESERRTANNMLHDEKRHGKNYLANTFGKAIKVIKR